MSDTAFLQNYLKDISSKIIPSKEILEKIIKIKHILIDTKKRKKKSSNIW